MGPEGCAAAPVTVRVLTPPATPTPVAGLRQGMTRRRTLIAAVAGVIGLGAATPASAHFNQESIIQDDRMLLQSGGVWRNVTLDEFRGLGVDTIRIFASWRGLAPSARSKKRPRVSLTDPASYGDWSALDGAIQGAQARGMNVILTPTGPGPAWAGRCRGSIVRRQVCNPRPSYFRWFVQALGRRYSGAYAGLPRVNRWAVWNEPNVAIFLYPQARRVGRRKVPVSPTMYRHLVYAAYDGLRRSGHGRDQMIVGETGPIGHRKGSAARTALATAWFWRSFFCLDARGRKLRGRTARLYRCSGRYRRVPLRAASTHPYQRGGSRSPLARDRRDEITMRSLYRLKTILRHARRNGRSTAAAPPLYLTEYGVQTRPPDKRLGVRLGTQAAWINKADQMAFLDRQVRGITQYLLRDDVGLAGFQSGLRFKDGRVKPAWFAYRMPIWVVRRGKWVRIFGQARPARPWSNPQVALEWRGRKGGYRTVKTFTARGWRNFIYDWDRYRGGRWRLRWTAPDGQVMYSRSMRAARR